MPELFFLNKKEQEKKNAPESNGSLVVGENQKVKVINSQEKKIFFFRINFKDRKFQEKNSNLWDFKFTKGKKKVCCLEMFFTKRLDQLQDTGATDKTGNTNRNLVRGLWAKLMEHAFFLTASRRWGTWSTNRSFYWGDLLVAILHAVGYRCGIILLPLPATAHSSILCSLLN